MIPLDLLAKELDRLVDVGGLPTTTRPGADLALWPAVHGLAVLLIDGFVHIDGEQVINDQ